MHIGLVGLGKMGGNMRTRLRNAGHTVVGYDRNPDLADVASLAEMVEAQNRGVYADDTLPDRRGATSLRAWAAEHLAPIVGGAGRLVS